MATISANTLFHFTTRDNLLGILAEEFVPHYSVEEKYYQERPIRVALPMVCFCDIRLSQIGKHMSYYGKYGIGMKKSWATNKRINPVIYLEKRSILARSFWRLLSDNWYRMGNPNESDVETRDAALFVLSYVKPYAGFQTRNGKKTHRRFYDEREWRFVPNVARMFGREFQLTDELITQENLSLYNGWMREHKLGFDPWHIQYIIISKEAERADFIHRIEEIKFPHYQSSKVELLVSKIISAQQILGDL